MDLSQYSTAELRDLQNAIPRELARRAKTEKAAALAAIKQLAAEKGFDLDDLLGGADAPVAEKKIRAAVAPKYRNANGETWTGRGKQPRWVAAHLASGGSLEQLVI